MRRYGSLISSTPLTWTLLGGTLKGRKQVFLDSLHIACIIDPGGRPQSRPVVINIFAHVVRPSVHPKTSKSSENYCRPGLWAGRVDHWWLLSCYYYTWMCVEFSWGEAKGSLYTFCLSLNITFSEPPICIFLNKIENVDSPRLTGEHSHATTQRTGPGGSLKIARLVFITILLFCYLIH